MSADAPLEESRADTLSIPPAERDRLARVIHDEVMQGLAACMLAADLGTRFCETGRNEAALTELNAIRQGLDQAVTSLRQVLGELRILT